MKLLIFDGVGGVKVNGKVGRTWSRDTNFTFAVCRERDFRSLYFFSKKNVTTARAETQILIDLY